MRPSSPGSTWWCSRNAPGRDSIDPDEGVSSGRPIVNQRLIDHIRRKAREHASYVAFGLVEEKDGKLGNNAILVDPSGEMVLRVSKMNLWHFDRDLDQPGQSFDVVDSPFGRVGLLICADARLPWPGCSP